MSRQDELERLINIHSRRLQKLEEQRALHGLSTPPDILLEIEDIEIRLEHLRAELERLREQAQRITLNRSELYKALLTLNFREQVLVFRQCIEVHSVGAFLVRGEPGSGQRWLLNRLVQQHLPDDTTIARAVSNLTWPPKSF